MLTSCNNNTSTNHQSKDTVAIHKQAGKVCYAGMVGKDSFVLKTETVAGTVTGTLWHNFYEKDDNKGQINGKMSGDTLLANYTFLSEGKNSVQEVAFLITDSIAIEGYGPMKEEDGKLVFTSPVEIDFTKGARFTAVACDVQ